MKIEMLFGVVAALVVVFAAAVFGAQYVVSEEPVDTTVTTTHAPAQYVTTSIVDYDPEAEMQYVYVQSQNIDGDFEELDEIQQRLYDVAEDYDPVEYDMLQEQVDNERTVAKYNRCVEE